jgi:hypothetical protein
MPAPPPELPESIIIGQFTGMKNTVSQERLGPSELERAINIDIDDAGQARRRRGYTRVIAGSFHSVRSIAAKVLAVRDGTLGLVRDDYSFTDIMFVGNAPLVYTEVNGEVYFCSAIVQAVISVTDVARAWGQTAGQGQWLSPVLSPTETLGPVAGKLLGDPIRATCLETYKGRIYMAAGKTLWATELFNYHLVDRTKNFMQFEHEIVLVMSVDDGLYVGTTGGLYFLQGTLGQFKLTQVNSDAVLPGSGQRIPTELVHPQARNQPIPSGEAAVFMTSSGVMAGFDNGTCYNLTSGTMIFPQGVNAASLFRQDQGANSYIAAVDSAGGPASSARIGDYVDAEIVRPI